ncbi:CRISPR-associated helicase Cas3' [Paenibacillus alginolyticus]|uniref:CRISPR-associated helicase Cas3 n=1 Tax=Paenibacillus alginolyticus TaxID=59839 RepID=A0ABT4G7F7_9BACL|nr:CRISPR-associated helicase Cas3' [Paenibacillus alginolyticus]MCY9692092.1 CRISPR-associated helicase Cas3' [Paenibacillus alginolyticus]MEC0147857.1 CRISPR-associated helicase Cas3' [Paenibacillus alginolyticus]
MTIWLSHPEQSWESHVSGVIQLGQTFSGGISIDLFPPDFLTSLCAITAAFHDLAKTTTYFQEYIVASQSEKNKLRGKPLYRHSLLSAVCAYYVTEQYLRRIGESNDVYAMIVFITIRRHHGDLTSLEYELGNMKEELPDIQIQAKSIDWVLLEQAIIKLFYDMSKSEVLGDAFTMSTEKVLSWIDELPIKFNKQRRKLLLDQLLPKNFEFFLKTQLLFSLLIDADKSQVGIQNDAFFTKRNQLPVDAVENYAATLKRPASQLNELRNRAFQEVIGHPINLQHRIYMLTLPTGLGKTLNSLTFALKLRDRIHKESSGRILPRIIYSLPFLSIIDQNFREFEKVFESNGISLDSSILLKHHHLSEVLYDKKQNSHDVELNEWNFDTSAAKLLIEGWNSEVIVTTFIQLFHTLISHKNSSLRKFHRLAHSIILIDEFQNIPAKYWLLLRDLFKALAEKLDCRFVFLTATNPEIFAPEDVQYICEKEPYFAGLNRVTLRSYLDQPVTIESFVDQLKLDKDKSYLFIVNTIDCAKMLYQKLLEFVDEHEMTYLSTHILPFERLKRIDQIRKKTFRIVVSTQMVEAGVDIDFDVVYRDWAPMDAINQSAGRCNRNGLQMGEVNVIELVYGDGKPYASLVYGGNKKQGDPRLPITKQLLNENPVLSEEDFLGMITEYYRKVKDSVNPKESDSYIKALMDLEYTGEQRENVIPIEHFKLIDEEQSRLDVFFEYESDENLGESAEVWGKFVEVNRLKDPIERKNAFLKIRSTFYKYVIPLPRHMKNPPPEVEGILFVGKSQMKDYYNPITGYRNESVTMIF